MMPASSRSHAHSRAADAPMPRASHDCEMRDVRRQRDQQRAARAPPPSRSAAAAAASSPDHQRDAQEPVSRRSAPVRDDARANAVNSDADSNQADAAPHTSSNGRKWCQLCAIYVFSSNNMQQHLSGKKHKAKLKQSQSRTAVQTARARRDNEDGASARDAPKKSERTANRPHAAASSEGASHARPSATTRAGGKQERGWNARASTPAHAGSGDLVTSNANNSGASALRSSPQAPHAYGATRSKMDVDTPCTPSAASTSNGSEGNAEGTETARLGSRRPSMAQRGGSEDGGCSTTADAGRCGAQPTDRVHTLKPIPWDPFASEYDASKVGKQGARIPQDFLDEKMSMSEWRELRRAVSQKGDDVDKLAFKILVETLLSPTLGVREDALDGLNSAIKKMNNAHYYSKETGSYMRSDGVPEKLWKREKRFRDGDEDWLRAQSGEDIALHLMCENLHYMFDQSEDVHEAKQKANIAALPFRGGVTGIRSDAGRMIDGVRARHGGDVDAVENDELFHQIHAFLAARKMRSYKNV